LSSVCWFIIFLLSGIASRLSGFVVISLLVRPRFAWGRTEGRFCRETLKSRLPFAVAPRCLTSPIAVLALFAFDLTGPLALITHFVTAYNSVHVASDHQREIPESITLSYAGPSLLRRGEPAIADRPKGRAAESPLR